MEKKMSQDFRIHIQGIDTLDAQWVNRIQKYGSITDIYFPKDDQGNSKHYGFFTINSCSDQVKKFMGTFQNTKHRGQIIQIQMAKRDFLTRLSVERAQILHAKQFLPLPSKRSLKRKRILESEDIHILVSDVQERKGWKNNKWETPVVLFKYRDPRTRRTMIADPTKSKNACIKLEQLPMPFVSVKDLKLEMDSLLTMNKTRTQNTQSDADFVWNKDTGLFTTDKNPQKFYQLQFEQRDMLKLANQISNQGDANSKEAKDNDKGIVCFDDLDVSSIHQEQQQLEDENKSMASQDEDLFKDINIDFEEDTPSTSQIVEAHIVSNKVEIDPLDKLIEMEMAHSLGLATSYPNPNDMEETHDPITNANDSIKATEEQEHVLEKKKKKKKNKQEIMSEENERQELSYTNETETMRMEDTQELKDTTNEENEKKYHVNTDLRSLVFTSEPTFQLLPSFDEPSQDIIPNIVLPLDPTPTPAPPLLNTQDSSLSILKSLSNSKLFFFHTQDPTLSSRSTMDLSAPLTYCQSKSISEIEQEWEYRKKELTREYKKRFKNATRKREKMNKKRVN